MSSMDVDPNLFLPAQAIEAYSDAWQETTAVHEPQCRSWAFNATFDVLHHPALVDNHAEISEDYVQGILNQTIVERHKFAQAHHTDFRWLVAQVM